jgi:integrase
MAAQENGKAQELDNGTVRHLPAPDKGNRIYWDSAVGGFGVRVTAAGARSFILDYRVRGSGRQRRYTIGRVGGDGGWTVGAARIEARRLRRLVDEGGDPMADIEAEREAPTVADLCDRFEAEHLPKKRPSTAADYKAILKNHVRPHFGLHTKVAEVRFEDIDALHRKVTKTGATYTANRTVAVLSKMFSLAIRWKMRGNDPVNPAKGIERNPEEKRKRYLRGDEKDNELTRLVQALASFSDQQTANIIRVLLLTGCRSGEALGMRWAEITLTEGIWMKPGSTTKQKTDHVVPLSAPVRQLLSEIQAEQLRTRRTLPEYVFPSSVSDAGHRAEIKNGWASICKTAKISGLRAHDLRHSFASQLASGGASLPLIGALLGHSNPTTTQRYAHLFQDPQRAAAEKVAAIITAAGQPDITVEPMPLRPRKRRR